MHLSLRYDLLHKGTLIAFTLSYAGQKTRDVAHATLRTACDYLEGFIEACNL